MCVSVIERVVLSHRKPTPLIGSIAKPFIKVFMKTYYVHHHTEHTQPAQDPTKPTFSAATLFSLTDINFLYLRHLEIKVSGAYGSKG